MSRVEQYGAVWRSSVSCGSCGAVWSIVSSMEQCESCGAVWSSVSRVGRVEPCGVCQ